MEVSVYTDIPLTSIAHTRRNHDD